MKYVEPTLIQPTFVTHLPKELVPLAKLSPDDPTTVEVFECCTGSTRAPRVPTRALAGRREAREKPSASISLTRRCVPRGAEHGTRGACAPQCLMLLGQESIRDVILFPQLKPK